MSEANCIEPSGSVEDIEEALANLCAKNRALVREIYALREARQNVCPHDRGIDDFEGDDRCKRCGLIAETILPNVEDYHD